MMSQLTMILKTSSTSGFEEIPVGERGTAVSRLTINKTMLISTFCFVRIVSRFIIMVRQVCDYRGKKGSLRDGPGSQGYRNEICLMTLLGLLWLIFQLRLPLLFHNWHIEKPVKSGIEF